MYVQHATESVARDWDSDGHRSFQREIGAQVDHAEEVAKNDL